MKTISKFYKHFANDSLYKNSIYLMLSTAVMAFFGFFFWIINARLFKPEQVGIATTLISVLTLISTFSILGLGNSLIKYLPTSDRKNKKINTSFTIVGLTSVLIAIIYLLFLNIFSPKLLFVRENILFLILFILFAVFSSLNILSENVFIAYRSAKYVLLKNTILSFFKLALPVLLIGFGAYGIFMSVGIATIIAFGFGLLFLILKFNYLLKPIINKDIFKRMATFSFGNYIAGFMGNLPTMLLPIIILNNLGAKFSAYFYMAMTIANLLYIIPSAISQSLFAEGSYVGTELKKHLAKAVRINFIILIPVIIIFFFWGNYILSAFGKNYSSEAFRLLQLMTISSIFISINSILTSVLMVKNKIKELISIGLFSAILTLYLCYLFIGMGLLGIGIAWIISQIIKSIIYILIVLKN